MLLCSENTSSTVDSTQNKMILCHLSANLCLKQRRKEERGCLQEQQVGVCEGTWPRAGRWALPHGPARATSSPGDMARWFCTSWVPTVPGDEHQGADTWSKRVLPSLPSNARETGCSSAGSWQLRGLPSYWIMFCVPERGAVAEIIQLSSFWMKERIL